MPLPTGTTKDCRLYCDYARLVKLQSQTTGFTLLPQLKSGTALSGRHTSLFRGRGLNFEELRHYHQGDDIRNLDWKVTLRTGKPHVRCYTEEKDRHVIVCVDQRSNMFFSSVETMKSVVAAEVAALIGWRVLKDNDRIGLVLMQGDQLDWREAQRSQNHWLQRLKMLAEANQSLNVRSNDNLLSGFSALLHLLGRMKLRNTTLIVLSDWTGITEADLSHFKLLQQHNDVLGVMISDPLEHALQPTIIEHQRTGKLPCSFSWTVGNGNKQLHLSQAQLVSASKGLSASQQLKKDQLVNLMAAKHLPLIELDTRGEHLSQFIRAAGGMA
ncbi:DUF58 domain-containing protein [Photobacterium kasasachensis]|uniref:DUF58 domain-containing protein n=1 Tax=Photobacterium kasasachensis TaxID=2910240 RepID=UPI003D0AFC8B